MQHFSSLLLILLLFLNNCNSNESQSTQESTDTPIFSSYQIHTAVTTTLFWIGEDANSSTNGDIANYASAWDENWTFHFGGIDTPDERELYKPAGFEPKENPFYFALPFNDFDNQGQRKKDLETYVPWAKYYDLNSTLSICKNRWIKITKGDRTVYAQWEDVGPFEENDIAYVFGDAQANSEVNEHAGLDVSPAVNDYLQLNGLEITEWQFVDFVDVPDGPWLETITSSNANRTWYVPHSQTTWQWQLSGTLNSNYNVMLFDIDLFDTTKEEIQALKTSGKKVICYFNAGAYESWREDAAAFTEELKGEEMDGWDERWLDIRNENLYPLMSQRIALAKEKGCDGVEADNVDGYTNNTGFPLTFLEQAKYNIFLATEAHKLDLAIALKNDLSQINSLVKFFDFAINEQCHIYNECEMLFPFIHADKAVLNAEYAEKYILNKNQERDTLCQKSYEEGAVTLILPLNLDDSFRYSCQE